MGKADGKTDQKDGRMSKVKFRKMECEKCGVNRCAYSRNKTMNRNTCVVPKKEVAE
jgi:ribosomal protein S27E